MDGLDFALFKENNLVRDAVERCLLRILPPRSSARSLKEQFPGHNWAGIRAVGNILRHEYDVEAFLF
jgi:uncharacterized protein with HEPN domain